MNVLILMSDAEKAVLQPVTYMNKEQVSYMKNKEGEVKYKQDFVKTSAPVTDFLAHMGKILARLGTTTPSATKWQA
jgi:hypothetical protein